MSGLYDLDEFMAAYGRLQSHGRYGRNNSRAKSSPHAAAARSDPQPAPENRS